MATDLAVSLAPFATIVVGSKSTTSASAGKLRQSEPSHHGGVGAAGQLAEGVLIVVRRPLARAVRYAVGWGLLPRTLSRCPH